MSLHYCLYCKYYEPTRDGSENTEPEGICNFHTAIDLVYGHQCCEHFDSRKEGKMTNSEYGYLYGLRNTATNKLIYYYYASSQKHKALFSTEKAAVQWAKWLSQDMGVRIIVTRIK